MDVLEYLKKRVLLAIPVLFGIITIVFFLSRVLPGDPARLALGPEATEEQVQQMRIQMGLDKPLIIQYINYLSRILVGDFGKSYMTQRNVLTDILEFFPATLELTIYAISFALVIGVILGVWSSTNKDKWPDHLSRVLALSGISLPRYWSGIMFQIIFAFYFSSLPAIGRLDYGVTPPPTITGLYTIDSLLTLNWEAFVSSVRHLILPVLTLSLPSISQFTRMVRSMMIEEKTADYVMLARANGIPRTIIIYKYMLKNAFSATLTLAGMIFAVTFASAFIVEWIFTWPGIAYYGITAIIGKDFNAIVGVSMVIGFLFVFVNLAVDVIYAYLDPRIKYG
ncbi:MAG: ABC transporter permease [Candidatus Bathyarchaeia archaeon]